LPDVIRIGRSPTLWQLKSLKSIALEGWQDIVVQLQHAPMSAAAIKAVSA